MRGAILVFLIAYFLNVIPAFAPPTWMVFSFIGFQYPSLNVILLALVGALAATLGRVTLARMSRMVIREKIMSQSSRDNVDAIREQLERSRGLTFGISLFYAFTPFPVELSLHCLWAHRLQSGLDRLSFFYRTMCQL